MAQAAIMAGLPPKALETLRRRRLTCTPASSTPFARPDSLISYPSCDTTPGAESLGLPRYTW
jgi:hypothetical protein